MSISLRMARPADAAALAEIYAPYVTDTAITFEYAVPSAEEFSERIARTLEKYPYFIAENNGEIVGYAYAGEFHPRAAYDHSAELSIYVRMGYSGKSIGKTLYTALENALRLQNITNLYACIGYSEKEDEYLTHNSVDYHAHMGYRLVGVFERCGYKFGRWYSMVWMEKFLCPHGDVPEKFVGFPSVRDEFSRKFGIK